METATTSLIVLKELAGNPTPRLNALQNMLEPYTVLMTHVWIGIWLITAVVLLSIYWRAYRTHKNPPQR